MIYLFNNQEQLIKILTDKVVKSIYDTQELTDENYISNILIAEVKAMDDVNLNEVEYIAIESLNKEYSYDLFYVLSHKTEDAITEFTGVQSGIEELRKSPIYDIRPNGNVRQHAGVIVKGTNWTLGHVPDTPNIGVNYYYMSAFDALKKMCLAFGVEMQFHVEINGNRIGNRYIEFKKRIGTVTHRRVTYGHNALKIVKEVQKANLVTALIGRGRGEEVSSAEENESGQAGYGRKITFEDIEWKKANGKPVDKPIGLKYVEIKEATSSYGIKTPNGNVPKIGFIEFDVDDREVLLQRTYEALIEQCRPQVLFRTTSAYLTAGIGDTVRVERPDLNIDYAVRVVKIEWDRKSNRAVSLELGDKLNDSLGSHIKSMTKEVENRLTEEIANRTQQIVNNLPSADGFNTNWYGDAEPTNPRINDIWYAPDPEHEGRYRILMWNGEIWERLDLDKAEFDAKFQQINQQVEAMDSQIAESERKASEALAKAGASTDLAEQAKELSDTAIRDLTNERKRVDEVVRGLSQQSENTQSLTQEVNTVKNSIKTKIDRVEVEQKLNSYTSVNQFNTYKEATDRKITESISEVRAEIPTRLSGVNYLRNSDFSQEFEHTQSFTRGGKEYVIKPLYYWNPNINTGLNNWQNTFHSYFDTDTFGEKVLVFNESDGSRNWKALTAVGNYGVQNTIPQKTHFMFGVDLYTNAKDPSTVHLEVGLYHYLKGGTSQTFHTGLQKVKPTKTGEWERVWVSVNLSSAADFNKDIGLYIYGYGFSSNSILYVKKPMLSVGNIKYDWVAYNGDLVNDTKFEAFKNQSERTARETIERLTRIDREGGELTQIKRQAGLIEQRIETVKSEIPDFIGGKNLLSKSGDFEKFSSVNEIGWTSNGGGISLDSTKKYRGYKTVKTTVGMGVTYREWVELEPGEYYTYSLVINADKAFNISATTPLHYWTASSNKSNVGRINFISKSENYTTSDVGKWKLIYLTFQMPNDLMFFRPFVYFSSNNSVNMNIAYMKLEKGKVPTDWSPNYSDVVTTTEFHTVRDKANLHERILGSTETGAPSKIAQMVMSTDIFRTEITNYQTNDNLLNNASFLENLDGWEHHGARVENGFLVFRGFFGQTKYVYQEITDKIKNDPVDTIYTISVDLEVTNLVRGNTNPYVASYFTGSKVSDGSWLGASYMTTSNYDPYNNKGLVRATSQIKFSEPRSNTRNMYFYVYTRDFTGTIKVRNIKLEKGSVATPFIDNNSNLTSKYTQLADSIDLGIFGSAGALSRISLNQGSAKIKSNLIELDGTVKMNDAFANNVFTRNLTTETLKVFSAKIANLVAVNIDVKDLTGDKLKFIEGAFQTSDSKLNINGKGLKITDKSLHFDLDHQGLSVKQGAWFTGSVSHGSSNSYAGDIMLSAGFFGRATLGFEGDLYSSNLRTGRKEFYRAVSVSGNTGAVTFATDFYFEQYQHGINFKKPGTNERVFNEWVIYDTGTSLVLRRRDESIGISISNNGIFRIKNSSYIPLLEP